MQHYNKRLQLFVANFVVTNLLHFSDEGKFRFNEFRFRGGHNCMLIGPIHTWPCEGLIRRNEAK